MLLLFLTSSQLWFTLNGSHCDEFTQLFMVGLRLLQMSLVSEVLMDLIPHVPVVLPLLTVHYVHHHALLTWFRDYLTWTPGTRSHHGQAIV